MPIERDTQVKGWHFCASDMRLGYGDRREIKAGESLRVTCTPRLCIQGLHASERAIDALFYAPGLYVSYVELRGEVVHDTDKSVAQERYTFWIADAEQEVLSWAKWCALRCIDKWQAPERVIRFLKSDQSSAAEAAWAAEAARKATTAAWTAWKAAEAALRAAWAAEAARKAAEAARRAAEATEAARRAAWAAEAARRTAEAARRAAEATEAARRAAWAARRAVEATEAGRKAEQETLNLELTKRLMRLGGDYEL